MLRFSFVLIALAALAMPGAAHAQIMCHNTNNSFVMFCNSSSLQQGTNSQPQQKNATTKNTKDGKLGAPGQGSSSSRRK